jgi:prolyl-tRNA synthetase
VTGVEPARDFHAEYFDLRLVGAGDACPNCGHPLSIERGRLLLRSSTLRHVASGATSLRVLGADNKPHALSANIHTLDLDAFLLATVEQFSDEDGLALPRGIAPFDAVITPISYRDENQRTVCDSIYNCLLKEQVDVLLDDRDCSAGVKFKDADLIGVPLRITVGPNKLKEGKVELRSRRTRECFDCAVEEVLRPALKRLAT